MAMRVDHAVADGVNLAFSRERSGVRALLTFLERGIFGDFFILLAGDEEIDAIGVQRKGLVICRRQIVVRQNDPGSIGNERYGFVYKLLARWDWRPSRGWRGARRGWRPRWRP